MLNVELVRRTCVWCSASTGSQLPSSSHVRDLGVHRACLCAAWVKHVDLVRGVSWAPGSHVQ